MFCFPKRREIAAAIALVIAGSNEGSRLAIATATGFPSTKPLATSFARVALPILAINWVLISKTQPALILAGFQFDYGN